MCMTDLHFTRFLADLLLKIGLGTLIISQCDYHVRRVVHEHEQECLLLQINEGCLLLQINFVNLLLPNKTCSLELITFEILAAERLRLMGFDNRLIIACFSNVVNILIW